MLGKRLSSSRSWVTEKKSFEPWRSPKSFTPSPSLHSTLRPSWCVAEIITFASTILQPSLSITERFFFFSPFHVQIAFAMFGVYVLIDEKNVLDAQKIFVSMALINILKTPLSQLPFAMSTTMQVRPSLVSGSSIPHFLYQIFIFWSVVFYIAGCCFAQASGEVFVPRRAKARQCVQRCL